MNLTNILLFNVDFAGMRISLKYSRFFIGYFFATLYRLNINIKSRKLVAISTKISHLFLKIFSFEIDVKKAVKKLFIIFLITSI